MKWRYCTFYALIALTSCHRVGANPWQQLDYAEANCGTKESVLTTTGCVTSPPATNPTTVVEIIKSPQSSSDNITINNGVTGSGTATIPPAEYEQATPISGQNNVGDINNNHKK